MVINFFLHWAFECSHLPAWPHTIAHFSGTFKAHVNEIEEIVQMYH